MSSYITKFCKEQGLKMVDATMPLTLTVSAADVREASRKNSKCCAFARATKRQVPKVKAAFFFRSVAWLQFEGVMVRYSLPSSVQKEIVAFDRSRKMEPGVYQISKVPEANKTPMLQKAWKRRVLRKEASKPVPSAALLKKPLGSIKLSDLPKNIRSMPMEELTMALKAPTGSNRKEDIQARSAKRSGRHKPAETSIKRNIVHRTTGIRSTLEPVGDGDQ